MPMPYTEGMMMATKGATTDETAYMMSSASGEADGDDTPTDSPLISPAAQVGWQTPNFRQGAGRPVGGTCFTAKSA